MQRYLCISHARLAVMTRLEGSIILIGTSWAVAALLVDADVACAAAHAVTSRPSARTSAASLKLGPE